jgi:hypothetical protein
VGHSLTLLTAALLAGQTVDSNGKTCPCNKAAQGTIVAQPEFTTETRTAGWLGWRSSSSSTTTTQTWRTTTSEPSWVDNRPVLSRIRNLFGRGDNPTVKTETTQPSSGGTVVVQPAPQTTDFYRRLPTNSEPPLGTVPVNAPKRVEPASSKPAQIAPPSEKPLTIEIEPIEFRPAGSVKESISTPKASEVIAAAEVVPAVSSVAAASRPNPISPRFVNKVGQPGDYSWITGQLEIRGGQYILHYATPETVDRLGGSVVLAVEGNMNNLRNGDLVSAHGTVVQHSGRTATYRTQSVDLVER